MNYVAELKSGNKFVVEELYHRYHQRFYFFVLKQTASDTPAEEVVQIAFNNTFIKLQMPNACFA